MGETHWYAAKVRNNRMQPIRERLAVDRVGHFVPEIIGSLVFMQTTDEYLARFEQSFFSQVYGVLLCPHRGNSPTSLGPGQGLLEDLWL